MRILHSGKNKNKRPFGLEQENVMRFHSQAQGHAFGG